MRADKLRRGRGVLGTLRTAGDVRRGELPLPWVRRAPYGGEAARWSLSAILALAKPHKRHAGGHPHRGGPQYRKAVAERAVEIAAAKAALLALHLQRLDGAPRPKVGRPR